MARCVCYNVRMFIGRENYLKELELLWDKRGASLVTCRGRRRIGKSTLIEEFARRSECFFIPIVGLAPRKGMTDRRQRQNFCEMLAALLNEPKKKAESWSAAFRLLDAAIPKEGRVVVLLDEISWMGAHNPDFAAYLKNAWDLYWRKHDNLVLVLCGSVSSWIVDNILNSTGFVGRDSLDIDVGEMTLAECNAMFGIAAGRLSVREKLDFLSITGGVPKYLDELRLANSVDENVQRMCFSPKGLLFREFDEMFSGVFGRKVESRGKILRALARGPMSASEISKAIGVAANGRLTQMLRELEYAGFIHCDAGLSPETREPLRQERYRISDNYTRFYLRYIESKAAAIEQGLYAVGSMEQLPDWQGMLGLQFENLVVNHARELFPALGLEHTLVLSAAPYLRRGKAGEGLQIDLLIQTQRTLIAVEIKHGRHIGREVIFEMSEKLSRLKYSSELSLRTALVYDGSIDASVAAEHAFDFMIPFGRLLS